MQYNFQSYSETLPTITMAMLPCVNALLVASRCDGIYIEHKDQDAYRKHHCQDEQVHQMQHVGYQGLALHEDYT
jgi:hypothetical protein